ncbi:MAG: MarR family transcriptional regulator [Caldisericia bacterium]
MLNHRGPMIPSELEKLMDVRKSTMTAIIEFLSENGFVVVKQEETDRRKKTIYLTEKGIEKARNRENIMMDTVFESVKHLDEKSTQEVIEHLRKVNRILSGVVN